MVSIGTLVWGTNIATMIATATAIEATAWRRSARASRRAVGVLRGQLLEHRHRGRRPGRPRAWRERRSRRPRSRRRGHRDRRAPGGSGSVAISVARLTVASSTPGVLRRKRSIRFTHEAQVMPSIGQLDLGRGRVAVGVVRHTPREYSRRVAAPRLAVRARLATLAGMPPTEIAVLTLPGPLGPYRRRGHGTRRRRGRVGDDRGGLPGRRSPPRSGRSS